VLLTARAECYHVGHPDAFRESVRRLQAYAEAGADVLFAPGPDKADEIRALVEAVRPKPFNLLVVRDIGLGVSDIAALGVRRISVGGALALAAWTGFLRASQTLKSEGSFAGFARLAPYADINGFLAEDLRARKRVIDNPLDADANADVGAPYARLCNTLEINDKNVGELDCDVPQTPGTDPSMRRRRL